VVERALEGEKPRRAPASRLRPGQGEKSASERTPGGSKASKWACRPLTGEPSVGGKVRAAAARSRVEVPGLAIVGNRRLGSCVPVHFRVDRGQRVAAAGKAVVKHLSALRRRQSVDELTRKQVARESGYGSSGRESSAGTFQGRERHGIRPRSVGAPRRTAGSARIACVPRVRPEPSRGARTLRTAPTGVWRSSSTMAALGAAFGEKGHPA
jgi:hypothetical protein